MALDVWIYGPGFGESILLIWDAEGSSVKKPKRQAVFVDCYGGSGRDDHQTLRQWLKKGEPEVVLVAVTHPHLDHIKGAGVVMRAVEQANLKRAVWWGGQELRRTRVVYDQESMIRAAEAGKTATMTRDYLDMLIAIQDGSYAATASPRPVVDAAMQLSTAYSGQSADGPVRFHAVSPWVLPQTPYVEWVNAKVRGTASQGVANCTSMGFLIEYGDAQILLGGDVEKSNWEGLRNAQKEESYKLPPLRPCLVKVSHHSSCTGHSAGMWDAGRGFFGSADSGSEPPHCVITPWRRGPPSRHLPDQDVVAMIARAGCHVWTTASDPGAIGVDRSTRPIESFIHFTVDSVRNRAMPVEQKFCRHTTPAVPDR